MKRANFYLPIILFTVFFSIDCSYGQITFEKTITVGSPSSFGVKVLQTSDNGYAILVNDHNYNFPDYLIKTDPNGDTLWTKAISEPGLTTFSDFCITADNGYLIVGGINEISHVIRLDSIGEIVWDSIGVFSNFRANTVVRTFDNNYVITFNTEFSKINDDGETIWTHQYNDYNNFIQLGIENADSGITLVVRDSNYYTLLLKTDSLGNQLWSQFLDMDYFVYSLMQNNSGDYSMVGDVPITIYNSYTQYQSTDSLGNLTAGQPYPQYNSGLSMCAISNNEYVMTAHNDNGTSLLVKIDYNGEIIWEKPYGERLHDVRVTNDYGLISTGYAGYNNRVLLLKTNIEGILTALNESNSNTGLQISVSPNPAGLKTTITYKSKYGTESDLYILNTHGQTIKSVSLGAYTNGTYELNCSALSTGIYYIIIKTESEVLTEKLVIK